MKLGKTLNNQGFGIMDAMIISSILVAMVTSFASYQFHRSKELKAQDIRASAHQIQDNTKNSAAQTQSLSKSEELGFGNL